MNQVRRRAMRRPATGRGCVWQVLRRRASLKSRIRTLVGAISGTSGSRMSQGVGGTSTPRSPMHRGSSRRRSLSSPCERQDAGACDDRQQSGCAVLCPGLVASGSDRNDIAHPRRADSCSTRALHRRNEACAPGYRGNKVFAVSETECYEDGNEMRSLRRTIDRRRH